jgi:hypothetical protein
VESLDRVCEAITTITERAYECTVHDGVFAEHGRAGLLLAYASSSSTVGDHLPVIAGETGWSVFPSVLQTWDDGNEINLARTSVTFESWPSDGFGDLIVIEIAAVTTLWGRGDSDDEGEPSAIITVAEEHHWRKVICASGGDTPRCTAAIVHRIERHEARGDSLERAWRWEAELRLDDDELVIRAPARLPERLGQLDDGVLLRSGRHSLEQLLAVTETWAPSPR